MDNCELIDNSKKAIEEFILDGDTTGLYRQWCTILKDSLSNNDDDIDSRIDLMNFLYLMERIIKNGFNKQRAKIEYIQTQMGVLRAEMLDVMSQQKKIFQVRGAYEGNKKICYLDQNIFTPYINGNDIPIEIPNDYLVVYSPAHIEEVSKSPKEFHEKELNNISQKLNDLEILFRDDVAAVVYESPQIVYKRVNDGTKSRELAEDYKILQDQFEECILGEYRTDKRRQEYNSKSPDTFLVDHEDLVNEVLCKMHRTYRLQDIMEVNGSSDYRIINQYIHDLYMVLDICGVKKDNKERKIRSSRLDIEHLLYASNAQMFVTDDTKLRCRAINIFSVLGKDIKCPILENKLE